MLNMIQHGGHDVVFIGVRTPDQYTHFQWHEEYRRELLKDIAFQVQQWEQNHDVFWWSDHGSEEKKEVFRVNKWLQEKGYLNLDVDLEFHEKFSEEMESRQPQQGGGMSEIIENQLAVHAPGVEIAEGSQAVCADPYDSCIDVLDDDLDLVALSEDMMDTGYYDRVVPTEEEWGDGPFRDTAPDLVTLRADNILVTGNVHPDPIGMGFHRTGVHSKRGAWGTTDEEFDRSGPVSPRQLHGVIWEFVTGESPESGVESQVQRRLEDLQRQFPSPAD
jgi:predicted AlkP superfamily phosphohydrolase/phosphomutase